MWYGTPPDCGGAWGVATPGAGSPDDGVRSIDCDCDGDGRDRQDDDSSREYRDPGGEHASQPVRAGFERRSRRQCANRDVQRSLLSRRGPKFDPANRGGASYSAVAASIPAISNANPTANQRSSGLINGNIRDAYFGLPRALC